MSGGGGQSGTSNTQATISPELQPLFQNTANILLGLQSPELRGTEFGGQQIPSTTPLDAFLGRNAQVIPGATSGQQNILSRTQIKIRSDISDCELSGHFQSLTIELPLTSTNSARIPASARPEYSSTNRNIAPSP